MSEKMTCPVCLSGQVWIVTWGGPYPEDETKIEVYSTEALARKAAGGPMRGESTFVEVNPHLVDAEGAKSAPPDGAASKDS